MKVVIITEEKKEEFDIETFQMVFAQGSRGMIITFDEGNDIQGFLAYKRFNLGIIIKEKGLDNVFIIPNVVFKEEWTKDYQYEYKIEGVPLDESPLSNDWIGGFNSTKGT